jgi:peroxidase
MVMAWGQYVNHDITFTPKSQPQYKDGVIDCCRQSNNGSLHPQCMPIRLGSGDYLYSKYGKSCFNFVRSAACPLCSLGK